MTRVGFSLNLRTRVEFGVDSIDRLGELTGEAGISRALVVTDAGVISAGHLERALDVVKAAGLEVSVYDRVKENPTSKDVDACVAFAREAKIDGFIGLGGGSSMDTAKGANFVLTNGGRMQDYRGFGKATKPMLPLVAVPTTAGTGSELQSYALVADEGTHQKMACGDPKVAAAVAVLDPRLTLSQPRNVTANTGMDAVTHAVETAVTRKRNEMSWMCSREAFRLAIHALPRVLEQPEDIDARADMQLGAALAGLAIEQSMLGAAHSAANPLTAHYGVIHGQAVGMMLPHVVRFNAGDPAVAAQYRDLMAAAGLAEAAAAPADAAEKLAVRIESLLSLAGLPVSPSGSGMTPGEIPTLAGEAAGQWTAQFNPKPVSAADFESLYNAAMATQEVRAR